MRTLPAHIQSVIASDALTLATCWRLKLVNGSILRFTDHHNDIVIGSETFSAGGSFSRSAITYGLGLSADNLDVSGTIGDDSITETDLLSGMHDYAIVEIFLVDYLSPNSGIVELCAGQLGEIELSDGEFSAQLFGQAELLRQSETDLCSPTCRANLGDALCKVNLATYTTVGTVSSVTDALTFDTDVAAAADYYALGQIEFTSGNNDGLILEIKSNNISGLMGLFLPSPYAVEAGDTFTITRGCDKSPVTCQSVFSNILNFRGEPFTPGSDKILQINNAKPATTN